MKIGKLFKYNEISKFPNIIEHSFKNGIDMPDNTFEKEQPIILELGCGKGSYSLYLAKNHPGNNIIGIDIKGARIYHGASFALENNVKNLMFFRIDIRFLDLHFPSCFPSSRISEIWINFPDPRSKRKHSVSKRLTSPIFLQVYKNIIQNDTILHLKTDSKDLYNYTLAALALNEDWQIIESTDDLYALYANNETCSSEDAIHSHFIQTEYEKKYLDLGKKIKYIRFRLR
jgi:tRNA (guanine-N7-)-methyltransferase